VRRIAAVSALLASLCAWFAVAVPEFAGTTVKSESCRLLRAPEITRAVGQPAQKGKPSSAPMVCDWRLDATDTRPVGSVHALLQRGDNARRSYALAKRFTVDDREAVSGLGDNAFYTRSYATVWVLEDSATVFYVQGVYATGAAVDAETLRAALVELAERAERRL
jgi:hypothetical protein